MVRKLLLLLSVLFFTTNAIATPALQGSLNVDTQAGGVSTTHTYSVTATAEDNLALIVCSTGENGNTANTVISGVTYNGDSLTKVWSYWGYQAWNSMWEIVQDDATGSDLSGTHDIVVTMASSTPPRIIVAAFLEDVDQTGYEVRNRAGNGSNTTGVDGTISGTTSGAYTLNCTVDSNGSLSATSDYGTELYDGGASGFDYWVAKQDSTGSDVIHDWTPTGAGRYSMIMASWVSPSGGGSPSSSTGSIIMITKNKQKLFAIQN